MLLKIGIFFVWYLSSFSKSFLCVFVLFKSNPIAFTVKMELRSNEVSEIRTTKWHNRWLRFFVFNEKIQWTLTPIQMNTILRTLPLCPWVSVLQVWPLQSCPFRWSWVTDTFQYGVHHLWCWKQSNNTLPTFAIYKDFLSWYQL
jgi:hypothetical protein